MSSKGYRPDVVTFTALISAYERGGQWRLALGAFNAMQGARCEPDAIVYNAIVDTLWDTGISWAQVGRGAESSGAAALAQWWWLESCGGALRQQPAGQQQLLCVCT